MSPLISRLNESAPLTKFSEFSEVSRKAELVEILERINGRSESRTHSNGSRVPFRSIAAKIGSQGNLEISLTSNHKRALLLIAGIAITFTLFSLFAGQAKPRTELIGVQTEVSPAASLDAPLVVDVQGAVLNPGLYQLSQGSRVGDAIKAAGGVGKDGDTSSVNLARFLEDGEQIYVTEPGIPTMSGMVGSNSSSFTSEGSARAGRLNLNRASENELDGLPGVGPVLAKRIVTYRAERGNFGTVDDLKKVSGIGPAKFSELRNFVTV